LLNSILELTDAIDFTIDHPDKLHRFG